ncbi:hypothetical protein Dsin_012720 [Dipteronia sinensis]|uniref:Cyclic nucleotide-binding domain-containing protein n=1 Tax=Dipteronia sinensis TaxID=43782 RepID=A0AAE0AJD0_9ROSI|nr:hypothetical protein Dsin_012720 [Dipteronia sinensis]
MEIRAPIFSIVLGIFLVVYLVRVIGIYRLFTEEVTRTSSNKLAKAALIKIVLNLLLYLYGGHLFGGLWYLLAVWKKMECWKKACSKHDGCHYANHRFNVGPGDNKFLNDICFPKTEDTKSYELGIFKDAFESRIVDTTTEFWNKLLYCFRWGIQNLSGFGQNLEVSTHAWENIFVILIAIYGMGTFTFFIGNMQVGIHYFQEKRWRKEEIRRKQEETEKWVPFRNLSEKLQNVIKEYQQYNWNGDVDVKNLLSNLPENHEINVKRELCLELLKKVEKFGMLKEKSLFQLCDCVKPMVYAERAYIVRQGDPTDKMLFVLQGKLWTFSSSSRVTVAGSSATHNVSHPKEKKDILKNGDFWGEELVNWFQNIPSSSKVPNSDRTVQALTKVEAFVLMAGDLKHLYDQKADVIKSVLKTFMISKRNATTTSTQEQTPPLPGEGELNIGPEIIVQGQ